jgi:hypothetical protein
MSGHALLSASACERWSNCAGALALSQGVPPGSSTNSAAREGTAGHEVADWALSTDSDPLSRIGDTIAVDGEEVEITQELAEAVEIYVEYVRGFSGERFSELRVNYSAALGLPAETAWGTTDAMVVQGRVLHVFDLKLGRRYVDPKFNRQMMLYAAGAIDVLSTLGHEIDSVVLHVVQPRVVERPIPFPMSLEELNEHIQAIALAGAYVIEAMDTFTGLHDKVWATTYLNPGEKQCQFCPATAFCPAVRNMAREHVDEEFDVVALRDTVPGESLAEAMEMIPVLKIFIDAVQAEVNRRLSAGMSVPNYKLVKGREGNRKWADEAAALAALEAAGVPQETVMGAPKLLTAPQVEKALKKSHKQVIADLLPTLVVRAPAKPTLTTADDPREPWSNAASIDEFSVVE